jgi:hypothetical protein
MNEPFLKSLFRLFQNFFTTSTLSLTLAHLGGYDPEVRSTPFFSSDNKKLELITNAHCM